MPRFWPLVLAMPLLGCGLTLAYDGAEDAGGGPGDVDGGRVIDAAPGPLADAAARDAMPPDAATRADGAAPTDACIPEPGLPAVVSGLFQRGAAVLAAGEGPDQLLALPFVPDRIELDIAPPTAEGDVTASLVTIGRDGVRTTSSVRSMGCTVRVELFLPDVSAVGTGYYCVRVDGTGAAGMASLDGEWSGRFPSGDGVEGGLFSYLFAILVGDVDGDLQVEPTDCEYIADNFGATDPRGDLNGSGVLDPEDASICLSHQGNSMSRLPSFMTGCGRDR